MLVLNTRNATGSRRRLNDPRNFVKIRAVANAIGDEFEIEYDRRSDSAATRWMKSMGYDSTYIVEVAHDFDHDDPANEGKLETFTRMVNEGFTINMPEFAGRHFVLFGQSAAGKRSCTSVFMDAEFKEAFMNWYSLGFKDLVLERFPREKLTVVMLQAFSSTKPWNQAIDSETRALIDEPNLSRMVLCNDIKTVRDLMKVKRVAFGKVILDEEALCEKDNDGIAVVLFDFKKKPKTPEEEEEFLRKVAGAISTGRWNFTKCLCLFVYRETVKAEWPGLDIPDKWDRHHDVDETDIIVYDASFKGSCVWRTAEEFDEYKKRLVEYGNKFLVCKQAHPYARKRIPTQQMQAILPTPEEEKILIWKGTADLHKIESVPGLTSMVRNKYERQVAKMMPSYLNEPLIMDEIQSAHLGKVKTALSGCLDDGLNYLFAAPDMYMIMSATLGLDPKPLLKAGEVTIDHPSMPYGNLVVVMRNPTGERGIPVRRNVTIPSRLKGLFIGPLCFFSSRDASMNVMAMDFDGDIVGVFTVKSRGYSRAFYNALRRAWETVGYRCLVFKSASPKTPYSEEGLKDDTIRSVSSPVGLVAHAITRLIDWQTAHLSTMTPERAIVVENKLAILEAALTLLIDTAKNGTDEDIAETCEEAKKLIKEIVLTIQAPMHTFWKKRVKTDDIVGADFDLQKVIQNKMEYRRRDGAPKFVRRDNFMGRYTAAVENDVVVKLPIEELISRGEMGRWCPDGPKNASAQWRMFCKTAPTKKADFGFNGIKYDADTHETTWGVTLMGKVVGYFMEIRAKYTNHKLLSEKLNELVPAVKKRIFELAAEQGLDEDQTIATVVMKFYTMNHCPEKRSELIVLKSIKDVIWLLFGEELVSNLRANMKSMYNIDFEIEPDPEDNEDKFASFEPTDEELESMAQSVGEDYLDFVEEVGCFDD